VGGLLRLVRVERYSLSHVLPKRFLREKWSGVWGRTPGSRPPLVASRPPLVHLPAASCPPPGRLLSASRPPLVRLPAASCPPPGRLLSASWTPLVGLPAASCPPPGRPLSASRPPLVCLPAASCLYGKNFHLKETSCVLEKLTRLKYLHIFFIPAHCWSA
jgi:hypothetical protein